MRGFLVLFGASDEYVVSTAATAYVCVLHVIVCLLCLLAVVVAGGHSRICGWAICSILFMIQCFMLLLLYGSFCMAILQQVWHVQWVSVCTTN
jgi:hypothetical protein